MFIKEILRQKMVSGIMGHAVKYIIFYNQTIPSGFLQT